MEEERATIGPLEDMVKHPTPDFYLQWHRQLSMGGVFKSWKAKAAKECLKSEAYCLQQLFREIEQWRKAVREHFREKALGNAWKSSLPNNE